MEFITSIAEDLNKQFNRFNIDKIKDDNFNNPIKSICDVPRLHKLVSHVIDDEMLETDNLTCIVKKILERHDGTYLGYIEQMYVDPEFDPDDIDSCYCDHVWSIHDHKEIPKLCVFTDKLLLDNNILAQHENDYILISCYKDSNNDNNIGYHIWEE